MFLGIQEKLIVQPAPDRAARRFPQTSGRLRVFPGGGGGGGLEDDPDGNYISRNPCPDCADSDPLTPRAPPAIYFLPL